MPLGSHRQPMRPDADLSLVGMGRIVAELLERLDLDDVTLVFNDWGGGQTMVSHGLLDRVGRLVLASCEAFDNYPPGMAGKAALLSAKLPGGLSLMRQTILRRPTRRLPIVYGQMSKSGVPDDLIRELARAAAPRRRSSATSASTSATSRRASARWPRRRRRWPASRGPVLVVWDSEGQDDADRARPHGSPTAFPDARLVEIDDSYTLIPIDRPDALAAALREFVAGLDREGVAVSDGSSGRPRAPRSRGGRAARLGQRVAGRRRGARAPRRSSSSAAAAASTSSRRSETTRWSASSLSTTGASSGFASRRRGKKRVSSALWCMWTKRQ